MERETSKLLMAALSRWAGRSINTSDDYQFLAGMIQARTGNYISPTTLKRIGGYLAEQVETRLTTLNILAHALGYRDINDFEENANDEMPDSNPVGAMIIESRKQKAGFIVELSWRPDRRCTLRYLGDEQWEVIKSEHTRLKEKQKLRAPYIIDREPLEMLLISDPEVAGNMSGAYVCGRNHGVRIIGIPGKDVF